MDEQQMEQRIRTAMEHAAPDCLDQVLASCAGAERKAVIPFPAKRPKRRWASPGCGRGAGSHVLRCRGAAAGWGSTQWIPS